MKNHLLTRLRVWPRGRAAFLAATVSASGLFLNVASAQLEVAPPVFVDVNATVLSPGTLNSVTNSGSLGGFFEARGGGTTVPVVAAVDGGGTVGIRFDGGDFLQHVATVGGALVPAPAGLVGVNPTCTIEVWVLNGAIDRDECILAWGKRGTAGINTALNYGWDAGWGAMGHWGAPDLGWTAGQDGGGVYATNVPAAGVWHHLAYTFDGTTQRVYSDGVLKNSEVVSLNTFSGPPIILGSQTEANGTTVTPTLRGSMTIGRVRIHDGVLSANQIATNYLLEVSGFTNGPGAPLISGPAHRYQFDNAAGSATAGSVIQDSVGTANGTILGSGATFTGNRVTLPGGASGTAGYVDLPDGLLSGNSTNKGGTGEVTMEGWVKHTASRAWSRIIDFGSSSGGSGQDYLFYGAQVNTDVYTHRLEVKNADAVGGTGGGGTIDHGSTTYGTNLHFAIAWNDATGEIKIYENGELAISRTETARLTQLNDVNVWLGRSQYSTDQSFQGEFDEFRIYNRVLSDAELRGSFLRGPDDASAQLAMFQVTGGGTGCGGTSVGLSGSEIGVTYLLRTNSVYWGVAVEGTGLAISFGNQSVNGIYSVLASNTTTGVTAIMSGSTSVTVNTAPLITGGPTPGSATNYQGGMLTFSIAATGTGLNFQWQRDGTNLINGGRVSGVNSSNLIILPSDPADSAEPGQGYTCVVSGVCGTPLVSAEATAMVLPFVLVDSTLNPGANGQVLCMNMQADGKTLVGGYFTTLGGQSRNYIGRLNADGTLDASFNPGAGNYVYSLVMQPDGKTLVGGYFTTFAGQSRSRIARLNADGTLDSAFNPLANELVFSLLPLADGKILVGGQFTTLGGQSRPYIGRLNADGSLDTGFNLFADGRVYTMALQADGKILVGGDFLSLAGYPRSRIARLNANGTIDVAFNPDADYSVLTLAVQPDGKILVGGGFAVLGGQARNRIARLNPDGSLDTAFNPGADASVSSFALQADGRILVGGSFTNLGGLLCHRIGRLNADGSIDSAFNPGANNTVTALALQTDGKILVGGVFTNLGGLARNQIARLNNSEPATQYLSYDGTNVIWLRGGGSPELWRATVDASTNGSSKVSLGAAERIAGGWQLPAAALPAQTTLRAWGNVTGGNGNASAWLVETFSGPLSLFVHPASRTNVVGTTASFSVEAASGEPVVYQWRSSCGAMPHGTNSVLTISAVTTNLSGCTYWVEVTNSSGAVTSAVATLTVVPVPTLGDAVNAPHLSWTTGGILPWLIQTTNTHDGLMAGQSGGITHSQESWLQTSVTGPGELSFWWSVSSEVNFDFLEFQTNGVLATRISGTVAWQQRTFTLGAGQQVLRWRYMKDVSSNGGQDRGYMDEVSFVSAANNPPVLANAISDVGGNYGTPFNFTFAANTFGDPDAGQTLSYSASGLPPGIAFTPATRTFSGTPTGVGTNSVTVTATDNGSPALSTNDVLDIVIAKAPLIVTAGNQWRTYAETNPPLTFSYSAFVLGESSAVLDTPPVSSTSATNGSPVGSYPITVAGGADDHYGFSYVGATLTITSSPLIVTAFDTNRVYGGQNPVFSGTLIGVIFDDGITASYTSPANTNSAPGNYPISPTLNDPAGTLGNYSVTTNLGTLAVTAAPLIVTANDTNRVFGVPNPGFTGSLIGIVNGDNISVTFITSANIDSPPGVYPIIPELADPDGKLINYVTTTNSGTLAISSPPLLSIGAGSGGLLTLVWPASPAGFVLEHTESLSPPVTWLAITNGIVESGGVMSYIATNDIGDSGRLYRLRLN